MWEQDECRTSVSFGCPHQGRLAMRMLLARFGVILLGLAAMVRQGESAGSERRSTCTLLHCYIVTL